MSDISTDQRVHPKLRMYFNGSDEVNAIRSETAAAIKVSNKLAREVPRMYLPESEPAEVPSLKRKKTSNLKPPQEIFISVFVDLDEHTDARAKVPGEISRVRNLVTAEVTPSQLSDLLERQDVRFVQLGEPLHSPEPEIVTSSTATPTKSLRKVRGATHHSDGEGVLIGIIDVGGFDFSHDDFIDDDGNSRFYRIWDQGGEARPAPSRNDRRYRSYDYGAEFRREHLNAALNAAGNTVSLPAVFLEPQSQQKAGSHATHVASIAAGNRGVCRKADIAAVLIDLQSEEGSRDRRRSFYDSARVAEAVSYLCEVAAELSEERDEPVPLSINISLGTNGHAHDGSSPSSRWIDNELSIPGRAVCAATGNSGQEGPEHEDDTGFIMGRIHSSGQIEADGLSVDLEWQVVGNTIADISENEMEIWYSPQDRFSVMLRAPDGQEIGPIEPGQFVENQQMHDLSFASVYSELYHPANGLNYIGLYLAPLLEQSGIAGVTAGTWTVRLTGLDVRDGRYHAWIERDDPKPIRDVGPRRLWRFPSMFSANSNVDNTSISSLACGQRIIGVANLDAAKEKVNISSSQGPTRDGREKPEVCAPGTAIPAANGFGLADEPWVSKTGTSMASPFVAGVVGLMLAVEPRLTAPQIQGILKRTALPLPGDNFSWSDDSGFGVINPNACITEARRAFKKRDLTQ